MFALLTLMAAPARADEPPADTKTTPVQLQTIQVIGTHIRGIDLETQHPVLVIDRVTIERTGFSSVSDVVQAIVANGETLNRNINNGGNGEQLINLRSLGPNRTLVLLNGRRFVTDIGGAVDLSAIPLALVERIEVLLDGASAIYGSDAIAGVINIVTRSDFEGAEVGAYYGQNSHGDGTRRAFDASFGHKADRWNVSGGLEYSRDEPIFAGARAISSVPIAGLPAGLTGSGFTPYSWLFPASGSFGCYGSYPCFQRLVDGRSGTSVGDFSLFDPLTENYNYAPLNYLQTPQERRAAFAQGHYEFSPTLALNADVLFNRRISSQQLAPPDIFIDATNPGNPDAIAIDPGNVYNPFGEPILIALRRFTESGPRLYRQTDDTLRVHLGLDGLFTLAQRDFSWGADVASTRSDTREQVTPYFDDRKLALALGPSFLDSAGGAECGTSAEPIAGCVPLNLFGPPGSVTPAMLAYIGATEVNRYRDQSRSVGAHVTTSNLLLLPDGALAFAAGVEYRHLSGSSLLDPLETQGFANGNGGDTSGSTIGSYSVSEAYVEFDAPLLADRRFAKKLGVTLGTRWSHYSNFGGTTNSQLGLRWQPVDDVLLRANWAQGFRAPSVNDLYGGAQQTRQFNGILDPCDAVNAPTPAVLARCAALGVPADVNSGNEQGKVTQVGNPRLQPETARSHGVGIVWNPAWFTGFVGSLDWYDIRLRNAIADPGFQGIVSDCYEHDNDAYCALVTRNPVDGTIEHVEDLMQNIPGGIETEGYDFALAWQRDTRFGRIALHWSTNYVDYFGEIGKPAPGAVLADGSTAHGNEVGMNSPTTTGLFGVIWRWRSQLQFAWDRRAWSASITERYFSSIDEDCSGVAYYASISNPGYLGLCSGGNRTMLIAGNAVPFNHVGSVAYTDVEVDWESPWHGRIMLGIRNALDRDPPVAYSAFANSFFPDYDVPGRFWWLSYRQTF
ncbi:MAG: TonB-dependent receptor [Proteobacteria bacterium]|nr:TonB-dependent receptor [Pseudomonadota bacterium]